MLNQTPKGGAFALLFDVIREVFFLVQQLVDIYVECIKIALPPAMVFFFGNLITSTILRSAFGGKFTFGR